MPHILKSKITIFLASLLTASFIWTGVDTGVQTDLPQLLIFSKTEGYRHKSIPKGVEALEKLANKHQWKTHHTEDANIFHPDSLSGFDAVIFLSSTGDILDSAQQEHLVEFMAQGGGVVGIHAAADAEYDWPWYGDMIGGYFKSHPKIQEASITVVNSTHRATFFLPKTWVRTDEWYNYKELNQDINVLMNLEESSYEGGENGEHHPIAWYHEFGGGRVFYTGGGHTNESFEEPLFMKHVAGGIEYVLNGILKN